MLQSPLQLRKAQKNDIEETHGEKLTQYNGIKIESLRTDLKRLDEEVTELFRQRSHNQIALEFYTLIPVF